MPYDLFIHRHNFAVWAAARAVQRDFTGSRTQNCREALEASGVVNVVSDPASVNTSADRFRELHELWCRSIVSTFSRLGATGASYGRSAKLLAVYLKSMVIQGGDAYSSFGRVIHPPIDENLLRNLAASTVIESPHKEAWGQVAWTQLDQATYYALVDQLRLVLPQELPFWMLEEHWTVVND